jgi:acetoin utilization deacetylase AcuC-like enzyme
VTRTGFLTHERYFWHDTGTAAGLWRSGGWLEPYQHFENADTKRRFQNLLTVSGLIDDLVLLHPRAATEPEVLRFHTRDYLAQIRATSNAGGGDAGESTTLFGAGAFETALLAVGGAITAVDAVLDGHVDNAYALVRPPGHHALADHGMGFCIFGNTALAALHARHARGVERVAIVDWDVHHGNGTQSAFWNDATVLAISLHQDDCYPPGSGATTERGGPDAYGTTINVPLPPGAGAGAYIAAFERIVLPALEAFAPALVLVASGLDASIYDPLARQMLYADDYRTLTRMLIDTADQVCAGRVVMLHEGGYSPVYVPFCGVAIVEQLAGKPVTVTDPFAAERQSPTVALQPHQDAAIRAARADQPLVS